jgi:ABC-type multidrug transport system fused ATPase/permease subunit
MTCTANIFLANTMGSCCTLASFAVYAIIIKAQNRPFDVEILFTSLTLISIATGPIFTLVQDVPNLSSALVCLNRVQQFLALERKSPKVLFSSRVKTEIDDYSSESHSETGLKQLSPAYISMAPISATNATFTWSEQPVLRNVTFDILKSSVNMIIGP